MNEDEVLADIEMAESELSRLGLGQVRVRAHGQLALLQAPHVDVASIASDPLRTEVLRAVRVAGFVRVAIDLDGP